MTAIYRMRKAIFPLIVALLATACAVHRPAFVAVPQAQFRSEEPVQLPLTPADRDRLLAFFAHGGNRFATDTVPDATAGGRQEVLAALQDSSNLTAATNRPARAFCEMAADLCRHAALFRNRPVVQQVVDARDERPPFPAPLAVSDGAYWWIFRHSHGHLTGLLVVRSVERVIAR